MSLNYRKHFVNGRSIRDPIRATIFSKESFFIRVFNAASFSNYRLSSSFGLHIIAVDGQLTQPMWVEANENVWLGAGQRIDCIARVEFLYSDRVHKIFAFADNSLGSQFVKDEAEFFLAGAVLYDPSTFTGRNINDVSLVDLFNWNAPQTGKFQNTIDSKIRPRDYFITSRNPVMQSVAPLASTRYFALDLDGPLGLDGFNASRTTGKIPFLRVSYGDEVFLQVNNNALVALSFVSNYQFPLFHFCI
eukprot:TRINITY_DN15750_c0_g1_i3.p1 TRINITY_DN15750_c0_g1~~TRINITY_DN15750_c0_g1_i3.p1  ORF type:complete len:269 (+),score=56.39 TRINITY_DN15750_c0_g1_i3:69-809(+)